MSTKTKRLIGDPELREAVKHSLFATFYSDPATLIVEELGLRHGAGRIDIAVINGELHGYELKSDQDTLRRLPKQIAVYNSILDRITLVVTRRHFLQATHMIPEWWDVLLAEGESSANVTLASVRAGGKNPGVSALEVAKLLWRDEALGLLEALGAAEGLRSKPRRVIYTRLVQLLDLQQIETCVRDQLKSRKDWRVAAPRM